MYKLTLLLAVVMLVLGSSVVTEAGVRGPQRIAKDDRNKAFEEFERVLELVKSGTEDDTAEVKDALSNKKSPFLAMAAVEAVRQGELDKSGSGVVFLPEVLALMGEGFDKLHEEEIFTVNVLACLGVLADGDKEATTQVVTALLDWQKWSENSVVRLRHMAERVLLDLTKEDCAFNADTLVFWEWWVRNQNTAQDPNAADKPPEKKSKTAPVIFKEPMVGTRVVFVIDVSDSMKWPIEDDDLKAIRKKAPQLKLPDGASPMDVAKAELVYSINKLRPDAPTDGKKKGTRRVKDDPEARTFAILTYSSEIEVVTKGWVEATDKNCDAWMTKVDEFETQNLTNIDGALRLAFKLSDKGVDSDEPALDKECVLSGAHTIVFLTDGYPTWSNDSENQNQPDRWKRENQVGDGEYVKAEKLIELLLHLNRFRKVVVNTVGIGNHDKDLMKAFAKHTGGGYTDWFCKVIYK
ncbi:MAG: VWA domain-containing protein [Planctomycetes bacterium]|nr:VWA domain-containing protein [Planctomycetota bacterium]